MNDVNDKVPSKDSAELSRVSKSFEATLNRNGFSFQHAVLKRCKDLERSRDSNWYFLGSEIPVESSIRTHIDFVCFNPGRNPSDGTRYFLVAECKRANPALAQWCFVKSPSRWKNDARTESFIQFDQINDPGASGSIHAISKIAHTSREIAEIALETKTGEKGDSRGAGERNAIDKAVGQVLGAASGLINYLNSGKIPKTVEWMGAHNIFIPVVFTTANLFYSQADISEASTVSGYVAKDSVKVEKIDWLWYNHNRSIQLSHDTRFNYEANSNYDVLFRDFTRSVAIVGPDGIDTFLKMSIDQVL